MARLQILYLPGREVGGVRQQPFALIIDEHTSPKPAPYDVGIDPTTMSADQLLRTSPVPQPARPEPIVWGWREFAAQIGAAGVLVTADRVDVVESDTAGDDELTIQVDTADLNQRVADAVKAHIQTANLRNQR